MRRGWRQIGPGQVPTTASQDPVPRGLGDIAARAHAEPRSKPTTSLVVELDDGRRAVLPRSYTETSVSLGYALTVFRAQGIAVDHAFGLGGDSLFQEAGYTQLSRGRLSNNLYVAAPENPRWEIGHHADDLTRRHAFQTLVDALSEKREQTMARDRLPARLIVTTENLDAVFREHASLGSWLVDHAPADVTPDLADANLLRLDARALEGGRLGGHHGTATLVAAQRRHDAVIRHDHGTT